MKKKSNKKKMLIINTVEFKRNGITSIIRDIFSNINLPGFCCSIIITGEYDEIIVNEFKEMGIEVYYLPSRKKDLIKYCFCLLKIFIKNKFNVLYIHGNSATMAIELTIAKLMGCKKRIAHSHNSTCEFKKTDKLLRPLFYHTYTHALACSDLAGDWLFPEKEYIIIKNGRDIKKYKYDFEMRMKKRKELGLENNVLAVGHVGNFCDQKNHEYLIRIFEEVCKRKSDAKLFLMGYGEKKQSIKELVKSMGIEDKVVFMGTIGNVNEVLQAMDVMCLPSLYEGLPLVVVEWQIAALPCIVSDVITRECAYTDLVKFVSLDESYSVWADKILEADITRRTEIAEQVIESTRNNGFDIEKSVKEIKELIVK